MFPERLRHTIDMLAKIQRFRARESVTITQPALNVEAFQLFR